MNIFLPTNKIPFTLLLKIQTRSPQQIRIIANDPNKPRTFYYDRRGWVKDKVGDFLERTFEIKMPQTSKTLELIIFNEKNGNLAIGQDKTFLVSGIQVVDLKQSPIWLTKLDKEFIDFAKWFAENASILTAGVDKPHVYASENGNFRIEYFNKLKSKKTGHFLITPSRIGHISGTIECSKWDFLKFSVPMIVIILFHEYSHKYKNPKGGFEIDNEIGADIYAMQMYLSLGYSEIEAIYAFGKIFMIAKTKQNESRLKILNDFAVKFLNGEFENITTSYLQKN